MKNKQKYHTVGTILKYHTVGTILKSNIKTVERGIIDTHDSLSWRGTRSSIKSGGSKLILWAQASPLSEMIFFL